MALFSYEMDVTDASSHLFVRVIKPQILTTVIIIIILAIIYLKTASEIFIRSKDPFLCVWQIERIPKKLKLN